MVKYHIYILREEREREMFYLTTHSTHFSYLRLYGVRHMVKYHIDIERRERNVLFNDTLNTFYLRLYGIRHMVKERERIFFI